jgi:Tfp pilus assembly protein PilN
MKAVNLIPGEQRDASGFVGRSGGGALIVLALLVGLAGLAVMYGSARHRISSQSGQTAALQAQTSAIEARVGNLTSYTSFVSMADQRIQTVSQLVQSRFDWSHSLHELGRVLPAGASLTSLHGSVGAAGATPGSSSSSTAVAAGAAPTSSTPPGSTPVFTLTGCATSQSEVAQTLQRLRLIDGTSEVQLQSSAKSGGSTSGGTGGGCPSGDPAFSAQVTFTGLPASLPPSPVTPRQTSPAASHSKGKTEQVSVKGKGVSR